MRPATSRTCNQPSKGTCHCAEIMTAPLPFSHPYWCRFTMGLDWSRVSLLGKLGKRAGHCDILSTILHIPSPQWGYLSMNQPTSGEKRVYEIGSGAKVIKPQEALLIAARPDGTSANFLGNCEWAVQKFMVGFQGAAIKLRKANHRLELR